MDDSVSVSENVLTNILVVIEKIFKHLNARNLNKCARVCKVWSQQVRREKYRREKYFSKLRWNNFQFEGDRLDENWSDELREFIMDGPVDPVCVLMFCTETLWCNMNKQHTPGQSLQNFLNIDLPSACTFQCVVTDGIIGTNTEMKTEEMEEYAMALSILIIGKLGDTKFISFCASLADCKKLVKFTNEKVKTLPPCFQPLTQEKTQVKMINLYCPMSGIDHETSLSLYKLFDNSLLAGGFVNEKMLSDLSGLHSSEEGCAVLGLAISGSRVKAASVLLSNNVQDETEVDAVIKQLTTFNFPLSQSFGLMYACVGRGFHVYEEHNVESKVFRKYFPSTPLLGFFGNGEIGSSCPSSNAAVGRVPKLHHAYTTVMCLVCFTSD